MTVARRTFLQYSATAVATGIGTGLVDLSDADAGQLDAVPFPLGVASGDPSHESVVLWTRVARRPLVPGGGLPAEPVPVRWEVAHDASFEQVIRAGTVIARPEDAHSVHVTVRGLGANRWYWYRFTARGARSRAGRTRTMPSPASTSEQFSFGFVSCQEWVGGRFAAYRDLVDHDLDLVVHLGDYIYASTRGDLEEFRRLHALYKSSPDLRLAHARFPFVLTWDDHEVLNNYAGNAGNAPDDGRPFLERRANAYRAYYEHLPLRERSRPIGPRAHMYRRIDVGRLARLSVLDTRQHRSDQACGGGREEPCPEVWDPARTMTGPAQERWLLTGLSSSQAVWNVIAQQTVFAPFDFDLGPGAIVNLDQWDGYPAARRRILSHLVTAQVRNPVIISGDCHSGWVNDVHADPAGPSSPVVATEFVGTSVSSEMRTNADVRQALAINPHVRYFDGGYRGWTLCHLTRAAWRSTYRIVLDPGTAASPAYTAGVFEVRDGVPGAVRVANGDGVHATVRDEDTGENLPNVELVFATASGATALRQTTGPNGKVSAFLPPARYTVTVNGVGYESRRLPLVVTRGSTRLTATLNRLTGPRARTGPALPGRLAEATSSDVVLENELLAMAVSVTSQDPQLSPATPGKPRDLAAVGHVDQLDWLVLPYASEMQPRGKNAARQRTARATSTRIITGAGVEARVDVTGASSDVSAVRLRTTYQLRGGQPWVEARTTFHNTGSSPATLWVGDAIDRDGTGQRCGVAGHGTITGGPRDYVPARPWIGMAGADRQVYGLLYDDANFLGYAAPGWVMSQKKITLRPGASTSLRRRVVAVDTGSRDPWSALDALL